MPQRSWWLDTVANTLLCASCQKRQPAGTDPANCFTPAGRASAKHTATGGLSRRRESVKVWARDANVGIRSMVHPGFRSPGTLENENAHPKVSIHASPLSRGD